MKIVDANDALGVFPINILQMQGVDPPVIEGGKYRAEADAQGESIYSNGFVVGCCRNVFGTYTKGQRPTPVDVAVYRYFIAALLRGEVL